MFLFSAGIALGSVLTFSILWACAMCTAADKPMIFCDPEEREN